MKSCNATVPSRLRISSPPVSIRPGMAGTKSRACSRPSTRSLPVLIGAVFITMGTHGTDQDMVQRMLTAPDIRRSRRSLILSGLADIPIAFTFLSIGLLLWVYYQAHPDPTLSEDPKRNILPFHSLSNASRSPRIAHRRHLRHRDGLAQHRVERARDQFHARLVSAVHQSRRDRRAKPARGALGDGLVFRADDRRRIRHFLLA